MMKRKLVTGIILGVVLLSLIGAAIFRDRPDYNGADASSDEGQIGIINVTGVIVSGGSVGGFGGVQAGSMTIINQLREAAENPNIKAVVLYINSPGGSPAASLEIGNEIKRLRQSGKKVIAYMADTAASGAYWISCETDRIVANPTTLTGSIGVIMQTMDLQGLYDKIGVDYNVFKTGPYKDMGSNNRDVTPEEREIFQSLLDDDYQQFVDVVAEGRKMDRERVLELADGRVYSGRQAHELGLVDQLGDMYDAVQTAAEMAGIEGEPETVDLSPTGFWHELFGEVAARRYMGINGLELFNYRPMLLPGGGIDYEYIGR